MRYFNLLFILLLAAYSGLAQQNTTLISNLTYDISINDVWGYVAPDDTEYAIVGTREGVSVVSLANPAQPNEVAFAPGPSSGWRDMKTWGEYAYAINETDDGLLVMDLTMLPDSMPYYYWSPELPELGQLTTCHNIFIDEFGYAYLAGCDVNSGGPIFVDVFTEPGTPVYVGKSDPRYAHDVYARDNIMYASDIYEGAFSVTDVSDKNTPVLLASQPTPFAFAHNTWLSDDSNTLFTTDERGNAPTAAYDISDLNNIQLLDEFRPGATIDLGVIPHNTHVLNDFLITSHYTDGVVIVDASRPSNLIQVGQYDTWQGGDGGFDGCWGAYPYLPSGVILGSDRSNGLFVIEPDYVRACYLEGTVKRADTGDRLADVEIIIDSEDPNFKRSNLNGEFATGQVSAGTFQVIFSKFGFEDEVVEVELLNGVVKQLDVEMQPRTRFSFNGNVIAEADGTAIPNAQVSIISEEVIYFTNTDENGQFLLEDIVEDTYEVIVGAWGYMHATTMVSPDMAENISLELALGYQDDFALDLGWMVESDASTGAWELGVPVETSFGPFISNPGEDFRNDIGNSCYITGNGGGGAGEDDVDDGSTVLISPMMDLTSYAMPVITYYTWFFNAGGNGAPNDQLAVYLSNGEDQILLEVINEARSLWRRSNFNLSEFDLAITSSMQIIFETGDLGEGHILEAAVDAFSVVEGAVNTETILASETHLRLLPNPFTNNTQIDIELATTTQTAELRVYNLLGQVVESKLVSNQQGLTIGTGFATGTYFVSIVVDGQILQTAKLIKQ